MPSTELLSEIGLLPPPLHTPWVGLSTADVLGATSESDRAAWPLFWYDPPWHFVDAAVAKQIVSAVDALKICTSTLGSDMGEAQIGDVLLGHTMAPYRPDRYGLELSDLQSARIVDVRLARARDLAGRYVYSPDQMTRWLGSDTIDEPSSPSQPNFTHYVPAPGWPPELAGIASLAGKFTQLRTLQPLVRCAVSVTPYRLQEELPTVMAAKPDIVILRMDDSDEITGIRLAAAIVSALTIIKAHYRKAELWVVPPAEPSADDCVKLYALGVSGIAIDWWCQPLITRAVSFVNAASERPNPFVDAANRMLGERTERIAGLVRSCGVEKISQLTPKHLVTASPTAAKRLGISQ